MPTNTKKIYSRSQARIIAMQGLYQWGIAKIPAEQLFEQQQAKPYNAKYADIEYLHKIITGTLANHEHIDETYKPFIKRGSYHLSSIEQAIIRVATYEFIYEMKIDSAVIINEAVKMAKQYGGDQSYKFINGVLDNLKEALQR